ncbi:MAG: DUF2837 family protein, partial [Verrucomicrobiae bacterium]|nr:DUF2837 family protein [Verrucomicrobiae bacterium]MCB1231743.1 DUF2837 family protein [Verrucomicrobiae bacterium]
MLWAASIAPLIGIALISPFQRFVTHAVERFEKKGAMLQFAVFLCSPVEATALVKCAAIPSKEDWRSFTGSAQSLPWGVFAMNTLPATGMLSALYAGVLAPEYRMTTGQLSAMVNFAGKLLLFALVEPYLSHLTDTISSGETPPGRLRLHVAAMGGSRLLGTILVHLILLPRGGNDRGGSEVNSGTVVTAKKKTRPAEERRVFSGCLGSFTHSRGAAFVG